LEDFYDFCQTLGDTTAEVMSEALAVSFFCTHFMAYQVICSVGKAWLQWCYALLVM